MNLIFTLISLATIVCALLALFGWWRRPTPGAAAFALLMTAVTVWTLGVVLGLASATLDAKLLWAKFVFLGIATVPVAWVVFIAAYTGQARWLAPRTVFLLSLEPIVTLVLAWTNEWHGLIYTSTRLVTVNDYPMVAATFGVWSWVHTLYSYALILSGTLLLFWAIFRLPRFFRAQAWSLLVGALVPWISNILSVLDLSPFPLLDLTPLAFAISGAAFAWALFRLRLLEIVPVARELVIEKMSDGLLVVDARDRIVDINPAIQGIIGLPARQIIGQRAEYVLNTWSSLLTITKPAAAMQSEISIQVEGNPRDYDVRITPMFDQHQRLVGRIVLVRDITDFRRARQELERAKATAEAAERAKNVFLATAGRELQTPLALIASHSTTLLTEAHVQSLPRFIRYLEQTDTATRHLLALVNNLIELVKVEMDAMPLTPRVFDLVPLAHEVVAEVQPIAQRNGNTLTVLGDAVMGINADKDKVRWILHALIKNASQHTHQGQVTTQLTRATMDGASGFVIRVSDTGIGIAPEQLRRVFEPFASTDPAVARVYGNTGLSLTLCQRYCTLMGGTIQVASELGQGTTFTVRLPLRGGAG